MQAMSDERLADIAQRNEKRRNWVLNTVDIVGAIEHGESVQDTTELLAEVERLRGENTKLRAIKNQLQQELAARPER